MPPIQSPISKDSSILIVGAGVFGLSTALHLAQDGYTNITVLDRENVPSPYSAGNDLNKIVRAEYEDPFYTELALDAIKKWQTPFWAPYIRLTGYVLATSASSPSKARDSLHKSFLSINTHPAFPPASFSPVTTAQDIRHAAPMLEGPMEGWTGYINKYAGYARAAKALEHAAAVCSDLGVKLVTGDDGYAIEVLYTAAGKECIGVKTKSGTTHTASKTVICLGAHIGTLLPGIAQQVTAKSWAVAHIQLTASEAEAMRGCPVVNCRDLGFFFEPDDDTHKIKLCANGAGYTNYVSNAGSGKKLSVPSTSIVGIPREDENLIKRLIAETIPRFVGRELIDRFICWCSDAANSDYVIDFVPGCGGLVVVTGDSGHAFKMLPIAGKWVQQVLEAGMQSTRRWKWKVSVKGSEDISWRVGHVQDIKDVQMSKVTKL
ncbi:L-saccharopine oxidase [Lachnellula occidentalis]|uniref:L-saccharopine oxidase n=1 Tax=Lachnellula occidentalis TaxID=215460 RepID=A0A8H8S8E4_9HELO|nr:L-saccharopine oxidase [Lachnellula occidentalis]